MRTVGLILLALVLGALTAAALEVVIALAGGNYDSPLIGATWLPASGLYAWLLLRNRRAKQRQP